MSNSLLGDLPEWTGRWMPASARRALPLTRRQFMRGGLGVAALAATMTIFDFLGGKAPAEAYASCGTAYTAISSCPTGYTDSCDKGCANSLGLQHSFYCIKNTWAARHRTCGEQRIHYDGGTEYSFTLRLDECSAVYDGWKWNKAGCGCAGTKQFSCNDGYYATRPCCSGNWSALAPSVCRTTRCI